MTINFYFFWPPRPELQRYHNYPFSLVLTGHQQSKLEMHFDSFLKGWNYFEKEEKNGGLTVPYSKAYCQVTMINSCGVG